MKKIQKLLVANRSENATYFSAATELKIKTVALYAHEDRFSLHRFKADEFYLVRAGSDPVAAYLSEEEGSAGWAKAGRMRCIQAMVSIRKP